MKILVVGLDGVASENIFNDERLKNLRRLMEYGCYGKLSYEVTSDRLGLWMSLVAGQDLGPLEELGDSDLGVIQEKVIWKQIEDQTEANRALENGQRHQRRVCVQQMQRYGHNGLRTNQFRRTEVGKKLEQTKVEIDESQRQAQE